MKTAILEFVKQFEFKPEVTNVDKLGEYKKFVVCGMGGSHLAADLLKRWQPSLDLVIHSNYGLPSQDLSDRLIIFSSYSGNTEEVLSGYEEAKKAGLKMAVVCVGGKLLEMAEADGILYVQMPDTGIQPRSALGFSLLSLMKLMDLEDGLEQAGELANSLQPAELESTGKKLAEKIKDQAPVIYSSELNQSIAYNWKIKLNETGKIPAFYNVFPELNHNEMNGFDAVESNKHLSNNFYFIFLTDEDDHPKIQKRMAVMEKLYRDRGLKVEVLELTGGSVLEKIFTSLILADWLSVYTAELYGLESEQVPMVEEFKRMIR